MDHLCYFCLVLLRFLFLDALWSPAGKRLTSWLSFVMSICEVVTFPLVSGVRCGAWMYWFLIFALIIASILREEISAVSSLISVVSSLISVVSSLISVVSSLISAVSSLVSAVSSLINLVSALQVQFRNNLKCRCIAFIGICWATDMLSQNYCP